MHRRGLNNMSLAFHVEDENASSAQGSALILQLPERHVSNPMTGKD
jgi:hypothetical protein